MLAGFVIESSLKKNSITPNFKHNQPEFLDLMKLKEIVYSLGFKPSIELRPVTLVSLGEYKGAPVEFFQWRTPKSVDVTLDVAELDELESFISAGDFAIDIGAHIGDSTLPIALACGSQGKVLAFEPNPIVFSVLAKNAMLNSSITNIQPVPFACGLNNQEVWFGYSDHWLQNGGDARGLGRFHGHTYKVPASVFNPVAELGCLPESDWERVKYIKIDVEGHEIEVLKVFETLIDTVQPYLKIEVAKFTSLENRQALEAFFTNRDYELRRVGRDGCLFGDRDGIELFRQKESLDIFCIPTR